MNLRTPLLAIGAALLLVAAVVLPASAAVGPSASGVNDCPNCDSEENMYKHQNGAAYGVSAETPRNVTNSTNGVSSSDGDEHMYQYRYGYQTASANGSSGTQGRHAGQASTENTIEQGNGDRDQNRDRAHLRDGSCGDVSNL